MVVEEEAALALDDDKAEAALSLFHSNWKRGMLRPSPSKDAAVTINYHYLPNLDCCMSAVPLIRELVLSRYDRSHFFFRPLGAAPTKNTISSTS